MLPTPVPARHAARAAVLRLTSGAAGRLDRWVERLYLRRHAACSPCEERTAVDDIHAPTPDHHVTRLDDPEGGVTVVGLRGMVHQASVAALGDQLATLRPPHALYLDLHAAIIVSEARMDMLARLIDEVESAGLAVRVAGLDPDHPALRPLTAD